MSPMFSEEVRNVLRLSIWVVFLNSSLLLFPSLALSFEPAKVTLPYGEKGVFLNGYAKAYEYDFTLEPGQKLSIDLEMPSGLYARLWEMGSNKKVKTQITFPLTEEIVSATDYRHFVLELRGQKDNLPFDLIIKGEPFLLFPVQDKTQENIISLIGDLRDEGIRLHEGIDIKAPQKTPLLAVRDGVVSDTGTSRRGGKFVMLRDDEHGIHYYYAHLHTRTVKEGQKLKAGDEIGTVGDTGNAKKGDYHLHFGVYDRRFSFINPYYYLVTDPLGDILDFETTFTFPLPFDAWVSITNQQFLLNKDEEGFFLKREAPLLVVGNSNQGAKVIFNQNVVYLNLQDLVDYARSQES